MLEQKIRCEKLVLSDQKISVENYKETMECIERELQRLKKRTDIGHEVKVKWRPSQTEHHNGKQLAEEVKGNTILIYTCDVSEVLNLVRHGFLEWLLNKYSKPYRLFINKLITLFEEQQYENKEKIIEALSQLLT